MNRIPRSWSVIAGLLGLVIGVDVTCRFLGLPTALLLFAGVLLVLVIMLMWRSLQALGGDDTMSLEEALALAAPPVEEEQKRAVLRSLKDLEFERRLGKVGDEDYAALAERYRSEARALLGRLDARYDPLRERIAEELEVSLGSQQSSTASVAETERVEEAFRPARRAISISAKHARSQRDGGGRSVGLTTHVVPTRACPGCGARNELSLHECSECNNALAGQDERLCPACPALYSGSLDVCPNCGVPAEET